MQKMTGRRSSCPEKFRKATKTLLLLKSKRSASKAISVSGTHKLSSDLNKRCSILLVYAKQMLKTVQQKLLGKRFHKKNKFRI